MQSWLRYSVHRPSFRIFIHFLVPLTLLKLCKGDDSILPLDSSSNPTDSQTISPTLFPTHIPSSFPTLLPTLALSLEPSIVQSNRPSVFLSENPTLEKSVSPSIVASTMPSISSSISPTSNPSLVPSISSSISPTSNPSLVPSKSPTETPSVEPSDSPSIFPSSFPTLLSSSIPSKAPSLSPSFFPSSLPTSYPTSAPTVLPSSVPTDIPTVLPSVSSIPSVQPTSEPTESPSAIPTMIPSSHPTNEPSSVPSLTPTSSPTLQLQIEEVTSIVMSFDDCPELDEENIEIWQNVTRDHIVKEMNTLDLDIIQLNLTVNLEEQCTLPIERCNRRMLMKDEEIMIERKETTTMFNSIRALQSKQPLNLFFFFNASFRSTNYNHTFIEYAKGAFNSREDRSNYIKTLQNNGEIFGPINVMSIVIDGTGPIDSSSRISRRLLIIIVASAGGGGLLVFCLILCICCRGRRKKTKKSRYVNRTDFQAGEDVTTFVNVQRNVHDDISTIGDPTIFTPGITFAAPKQKTDGDSHSESTYDYANMYGGIGETYSASSAGAATNVSRNTFLTSVASGSPRRPGSIADSSLSNSTNDDEQRIEVRAPPGKLGMVIDTPKGISPIVHAIREKSVMANKLRIGDKLIFVDGEDMTKKDSMEVSKIISAKANNATRVLVFTRSKQVRR